MKCPFCGRKKAVITQGDYYHCTSCKALFDDDPNEGGSALTDSPLHSLLKKERLYGNANAQRHRARRERHNRSA